MRSRCASKLQNRGRHERKPCIFYVRIKVLFFFCSLDCWIFLLNDRKILAIACTRFLKKSPESIRHLTFRPMGNLIVPSRLLDTLTPTQYAHFSLPNFEGSCHFTFPHSTTTFIWYFAEFLFDVCSNTHAETDTSMFSSKNGENHALQMS